MSENPNKKLWRCIICNEVVEGDEPPMVCPVCRAGRECFEPYEETSDNFVNNTPLNAVIIGAGIAALSAAEAIRQRNQLAEITLITQEPYLPYYRTSLTKKLARGGAIEESYLKPESWYEENRINVVCNTVVSQINPSEKSLQTESGDVIHYDKLLIATGGYAFIPPVVGSTLPEVVTLRSYSDLVKLRALLGDTPKKVSVVGGGLLGLEAAWGLVSLGHEVTVLEMFPILLPRQIDAEGAPLLLEKVESRCQLKLGVKIDSILEKEGHVSGVKLDQGEVPADIVLFSTGVRSYVSLAENAGIKNDRSIIVNTKMETSSPDIYAAGDCAVCEGRFDGLWDTASKQGKVAGAQMAGDQVPVFENRALAGATFFAFGTSLFSIGDLEPHATHAVVTARNELISTYKKFVFVDHKLVGGVLLGDTTLTRLLVAGLSDGYDAEDAKNHDLI